MQKKHLIYKIYPTSSIKRINAKINSLGPNFKYSITSLLTERLILSITIFIILFIFADYGYLLAPIITFLFYLGSEKLILDYNIKKRIKILEHDAIFFFEVLGLTLESGRNLKNALEITVANVDNELSLEFQKMLEEIKLGRSFKESLELMKERIPSDVINSIILSLIESSMYGGSIIESLNNQLDYLRDKKILEVKAEITKLPTKISIISVIFFIPIMFLVILSPVIITFFTR